MTTVAAFVHQGTVYMGADTRTNVYDRPIDGVRKILRMPVGESEILLGVAGCGGIPALLAANLNVDGLPEPDADPQPWADALAQAITQIAIDGQCTDGGQMDGTVLLGALGRVWTVTHMQAIPHPDGIAAVGSGEGIAIGAIDALLSLGVGRRRAFDVIVQAVRTAINRDRHSGGDVTVEVLPGTRSDTGEGP